MCKKSAVTLTPVKRYYSISLKQRFNNDLTTILKINKNERENQKQRSESNICS